MLKNLYLNENSKVVEINGKKDFSAKEKKLLNNNNTNGLVVFYAPWCGHCKSMVQDWEDIAETFYKRFYIGAVNCEEDINLEICKTYRVDRYPTFKYVSPKGKLYDVNERFDKFNFTNYICEKMKI